MDFLRTTQAVLPLPQWAKEYRRSQVGPDLLAGTIVTFITIPQVIAYAYLAGLPAETGLYAAIAGLTCYALAGNSRTLAVGPAAIVSMMALESLSGVAEPGTSEYGDAALLLTALTGLILLGLRAVRFGAIISFLSHAVVTGFVTAAACLIMLGQVPTMLGLGAQPAGDPVAVLRLVAGGVERINGTSAGIAVVAVALLWFCRTWLQSHLAARGWAEQWVGALVKSAPMYLVVLGSLVVWLFDLSAGEGVAVVGAIATHLPRVTLPAVTSTAVVSLAPSALLIAMVIFIESTSIGAAVASKRRERIEPNQDLIGLGLANIGACLVGGFPVAGSFARTVVNFTSGATSQLASLVTAALVVVGLLWLSPLFLFLPKAVLSAIIVISAAQLIDLPLVRTLLRFNRIDAITFVATFVAVLATGVERGLLIGIALSFALMIRASSRPNLEIVGRVGDSSHFRGKDRYDVKTSPEVLAVRLDENLYFVNTRFVETYLLNQVAEDPEIRHVILICSAVNFIDTSGLELLENLSANLASVDVTLHLAEVKGSVMDHLRETDFIGHMKGQIFFSTDIAMRELAGI